MLKQLHEKIIKEFESKNITNQIIFNNLSPSQKQFFFNEMGMVKDFIRCSLNRQLDEIVKMLNEMKLEQDGKDLSEDLKIGYFNHALEKIIDKLKI